MAGTPTTPPVAPKTSSGGSSSSGDSSSSAVDYAQQSQARVDNFQQEVDKHKFDPLHNIPHGNDAGKPPVAKSPAEKGLLVGQDHIPTAEEQKIAAIKAYKKEYGDDDDDGLVFLPRAAGVGVAAARRRNRIGFFRRLVLAVRRGIETGKKTFAKLNGTEKTASEVAEAEKAAAAAGKSERLIEQTHEEERTALAVGEGASKIRKTAATLEDLGEAKRIASVVASTEKLAAVTEKLPAAIRTAVALTGAVGLGVGVGVVGALGAATVGLAGSIVVGAAVTAVVAGGIGYLGYRWLAMKGGKSEAKANSDAMGFGAKAVIATFKSQTIDFVKDTWNWGKTLLSDPKQAFHQLVSGAKDTVAAVRVAADFVSDEKLRNAAVDAASAVAGDNNNKKIPALLALNRAMNANAGVRDGLASIGKQQQEAPVPVPENIVVADTHEQPTQGAAPQNTKSRAGLRAPTMSPPVVVAEGPSPKKVNLPEAAL